MVYFLFFYDMVMTGANVAVAGVFGYLYIRRKDVLHLWIAALFVLCSLDITLMYMLDFVPDFQHTFDSVAKLEPAAYTVLHIAILFAYRLIAGRIGHKEYDNREAVVWVVCLASAVIGASLPVEPLAVFTEGVSIGLLQLLITLVAARGVRNGAAEHSVLGRTKTVALVVAFALCSAGYLVYTAFDFLVGWDGPRNSFVELSGAMILVFALMYLASYRRRDRERATDAISADIAHRYGLTRREEEILRMLAEGMSNQEISAAAYIAVGTVKTHVHNIYSKLGILGRADIAHFMRTEAAKPPAGTIFHIR